MITRRQTITLPLLSLLPRPALADMGQNIAPPLVQATPPLAMVMNSGDATVSVINMLTQQVVETLPTYREPSHWCLSADRSRLIVCDAGGNALFFFDPVTAAPLGHHRLSDPYQLAFTPDEKYLIVNALRINHVDVYDAASLQLVKRFRAGRMPSHLDFSPDSRWSFHSMQGTNTLISLDLTDLSLRWSVKIGKTPAGVLWHRGRVLVALMGERGIVEVDPRSGDILRHIQTGEGAHNIFYDHRRDVIYISNRLGGSLSQLDPVSLTVQRSYTLPGGPDDLGVDPQGSIWVALRFAEVVAVMDPLSGAYTTIPVGRSPHGIFLNTELARAGEITAERL